jgi:hypothetical protein
VKKCPNCGENKPATPEFFPRCGKRGLASYCKPCHVARGRENLQKRFAADPDRFRALWRKQQGEARAKNRERERQKARRSRQKLRAEMVAAYGGKCSCCGEDRLDFLTLEHVNRDGKQHRASIRTGGGNAIWLDLKRRGWPRDGFTILCWNCHMATAWGHTCPHVTEAQGMVA